MCFIGKCACRSSARTLFGAKTRDEWLAQMETEFPRVTSHELTDEQRRAWGDCYDVLRKAFSELPGDYGRLKALFEYVLPQRRPVPAVVPGDAGVRADVLLLCRETVVVLEFKGREGPYPGCYKQARKYRNRLQRWHRASDGMSKKTVVVFTKAHNMRLSEYRLVACSPDRLAEVLKDSVPETFQTMKRAQLREWMTSEWTVINPPRENQIHR